MGVQDGKDYLNPASKKTSLNAIRKRHPPNAKPVAGIDVAIPMNKAMNNNKALDQAFAIPPIPATYVADYVWEYFSVFINAEFTTVAVKTTKGGKEITQDVFFEVMERLKKEGVRVIFAPFEADSRIVALCRQGIIEYAVTEDGDIPFQGAEKTIRKVHKKGNCQLILFDSFQKQLTKTFGATKVLSLEHIAILAAMLGNDYVGRAKGKGSKYSTEFMKKFCNANREKQNTLLRDHVQQLENKTAFWISLESWHHAPAFIVTSRTPEKTARDAFFSPPSEDTENPNFHLSLGPMSHCNQQGAINIPANFWMYNREPDDHQLGRGTLKLGFDPPSEFTDTTKFLDYFRLEVWCRIGKALEGLPTQENTDGNEIWPGAILDFQKRPIKTYPSWILVNWLTARDISCDDFDRAALETTVTKGWKHNPPLFILPKFLLRGAGGYSTYKCLVPANEDNNVNWATGDDALELLRRLPAVTEEYLTKIFGPRNGSRRRALLHLTGGSFDLKHLRVTTDLASPAVIVDEHKLVVVQATCTASQKLAKTYELRMTFRMDEAFEGLRFQRLPLSRCDCPVGCWVCAHLGALLLLIHLVQREDEWAFEELEKFMPDPIHKLVNTPIPIGFPFPRLVLGITSGERKKRRKIIKNMGVTAPPDGDEVGDDEDNNLHAESSDGEFGESDDDDDEPELELDMIANPGCEVEIPDVTGRVSPVMKKVDIWIEEQKLRKSDTGRANKLGLEAVEEAAVKAARPPFEDVNDYATQLAFFQRLHKVRSKTTMPEDRTLMDLFNHINSSRINSELTRLQDEGAVVRSRDDLPDIRRLPNHQPPDQD